jgi:putative NIF3 family GTP cyclohydrolase 1 type 2
MAGVQTKILLTATVIETAINGVTVHSAVDITPGGGNVPAGNVAILAEATYRIAQVTTTTPASGTNLILQGHHDASGSAEKWVTINTTTLLGTTAAATDTTTGAITGGSTATVGTTAAATFGARTKQIYIRDSSTVGEWIIMKSQAGSVLTPIEATFGLSHSSGVSLYDQAQIASLSGIDLTPFKRLRAITDNNSQATGPTVAVFIELMVFQP